MLIKRGKIYSVDFVYRKVRYQKTTGTSSLRRAREFEANMREKLRLGTYGLVETQLPPSLREFTETFLTSIEVRGELKPETIRFYKTKAAALLRFPTFRTARIDQINEDHIERFTQWRLAQVSPGTVDHELTTLRVLFSNAYKWKKLNRIPVVTKLNRSIPREFILNDEQEAIYLKACPSHLRDIAILLLHTGLRLNEALRLSWIDLEWTNSTDGIGCWLSVREGKSRNARRTVPVPLEASNMLKGRKGLSGASETFVFPSRTGKPYAVTSIDHLHSKIRKKLIEEEETKDVGFTEAFVLHGLRHTYLSRLGESGADSFAIMKLAGHGQVTTSQRYVHPTSEHLARTVVKLTQSRSVVAVQPEWADSQVLPANLTASETRLPVSC